MKKIFEEIKQEKNELYYLLPKTFGSSERTAIFKNILSLNRQIEALLNEEERVEITTKTDYETTKS